MMRSLVLAAVVALAGSSMSCSLLRRDRTATARIHKPVRPLLLPEPEPKEPARFDLPPPDFEPEQPELATLAQFDVPTVPPYHPKRPIQARRRDLKETAPEPEPEPETPAASVPELEQILTPEQKAEYNRVIDANIGRAQRTVELLNARRLNSEQSTYRDRVKEFIQQASEARKFDLVRAKNLAERAGVLADDLYRSVQ